MPVRIYSLAKELKIDSKELVEICTKAGITGKGSALASLTDEEAVKLKEYLGGKSKAPERPTLAPPVARPTAPLSRVPPLVPARPSAVPVLGTRRPPAEPPSTTTAAPPAPPAREETPPSIAATAAPAVEPASPSPSAPAVPPADAAPPTVSARGPGSATPAKPEPPVVRREDYMSPGGNMGRPRMLESRERPLQRRNPADGPRTPPPPRTGPAIKLAPMPAAPTPPAKSQSREPAAQKPDLRLPVDAIRAGKSGTKPLSEHIRKHEQKRKADAIKGPTRPGGRDDGAAALPGPLAPGSNRDRGKRGKGVAAAGVADVAAIGGRDARQLQRKRSGPVRKKRPGEEGEEGGYRRSVRRIRRTGANTAAPRKNKAVLQWPCTLRAFSEAIGVPAQKIQGKLLAMGSMTPITAEMPVDLAELLALEFGVEIEIRRVVDNAAVITAEAEAEETDPTKLKPRPPVITVLGHVDHGKTSLLDKIIGLDVAGGESGGITQHIRAYQVDRNGQKISFVDTPGHEAFTSMRARGANVTDIAILVVAADDGVMPQTEEAISHIKAAGVPIVVALNKIDLPGIDTQRIFQQLATNELLPTEWGGDVEVVKTSAITGEGIDTLLETLLTIAELHDFRANPNRAASGTCLEAEIQPGRGVLCKVLVQRGTLRVGDAVVCGSASGHIKAMYDTLKTSKLIKEAGPSMPVNIAGLDEAPGAGDHFYVVPDIASARQVAQQRQGQARQASLSGTSTHITLENLFEHLGQEEVKTLNVILRADVRGSIEAIQKELTKLAHPEVKIKMLQAQVGGISEADVHLADASDAIIIGFNVVPDEKARSLAEDRGVQIRRYDIIYKVTEDLRASLEGMLKPEKRESDLGRALVQRTFVISRVGTIAGCRVLSGTIQRNSRVRVIRESRVVGDYSLETLRREKDDAREVREGLECGIKLQGFNDLKEGDILEAYKIEEIARTFE